MFYNETKNNNIYRYLITSSTLLKFVPSNCQFDDYGNPLVSIEELQQNVGLYLSRNFKQARDALLDSFWGEQPLTAGLTRINKTLLGLNECAIRNEMISVHSLAKRYVQQMGFDDVQYKNLLYLIVQKSAQPQPLEQCKVLTLEDFKLQQLGHQRELKSYLEEVFIREIKQTVTDQLSGENPEYALSAATFDEYSKQPALARYLKKINFQVEDQLRILLSTSYTAFAEMIQIASQWRVQCESAGTVRNFHPDNAKAAPAEPELSDLLEARN